MAVSMFPLNGTRRLCRKLPSTISAAAHIVPAMDALTHLLLMAETEDV